MEYKHITVLKKELTEAVNAEVATVGVDCTFGGGGHSLEIINKMKSGELFVFDLDQKALENVEKIRSKNPYLRRQAKVKINPIHDNFRNIKKYVSNPDFIIADLGFSTNQLEEDFSFKKEGILDMRMDKSLGVKAQDLVNVLYEKELTSIFEKYADEKLAKPIARAIVEKRKEGVITSKSQLRELIRQTVDKLNLNKKSRSLNPEARIFQALRIAVNDELGALEQLLTDGFEILKNHGRFGIISFHSGEDRIVKKFMKAKIQSSLAHWVMEKARPSESEVEENPKAHSAILRVIEKH